jgi:two-component system sensor histidine kinase KdpD
MALDRIRLAADLEQAKLISETEQLRSALLSSVSHDLRTPLASIIGSATSLLEYGEAFSPGDRRELWPRSPPRPSAWIAISRTCWT